MNYAKFFTKRKDGTYQKYVNGRYLYSRDPEVLYRKWQEAIAGPKEKTFAEVALEWSEEHQESIGVRTWNNYRPHFETLIEKYNSTPISSVKPKDMLADLNRMRDQGFSQTVVKTRKTLYVQIMDYAVVKGYAEYNPLFSVKLPKGLPHEVRRAPTDDEIKKIFNSIDAPFGFYVFFLLCTGLRRSEALALTVSDIDFAKNIIVVSKSLEYKNGNQPSVKTPKTKAGGREVPIPSILLPELKKYMKCLNSDLMFPCPKSNRNPGGGYMTAKAYETLWSKYSEATGLTLTAHNLRHGTATILFEAGVDAHTAKSILGHSNVNTTLSIYTELRDRKRDDSIRKMDSKLCKLFKNKSK